MRMKVRSQPKLFLTRYMYGTRTDAGAKRSVTTKRCVYRADPYFSDGL